MNDPGLGLSGMISGKHQLYLIGAFNDLKDYNGEVKSVLTKSELEQTSFLENHIFVYLRFVNYTATLNERSRRSAGGEREGEHRNFLLNYEKYGDQALHGIDLDKYKAIILQGHLWGLFDKTALDAFSPEGESEHINFNEYLEKPFQPKHKLYDSYT